MLHKHQRALHKYTLMKRQMSTALHGREPESVEQLESRIVEVLGAGHRGAVAWDLSPGGLSTPGSAGPWSWSHTAAALGASGRVAGLCGSYTEGGLEPRGPGAQQCVGRDCLPGREQGNLFALQQENAIQTMELRNYFSLYCLHQEMQLVHTYLPLTSHILGAFVNSQIQGHKEVGPLAPPPSPLSLCCPSCKPGSPHKRP